MACTGSGGTAPQTSCLLVLLVLVGGALCRATAVEGRLTLARHSISHAGSSRSLSTVRSGRQLQQARTADFVIIPSATIELSDIDCGQGPSSTFIHPTAGLVAFCRICGGVAAVADACARTPSCVAFTFGKSGVHDRGCGYLKTSTQSNTTSTEETLFCDQSLVAACRIDGAYAFSANADLQDVGDYDCGYTERGVRFEELCFVPGTINQVAERCQADPRCKGFVTASRADVVGGYLKDAVSPAVFNSATDKYLKMTTGVAGLGTVPGNTTPSVGLGTVPGNTTPSVPSPSVVVPAVPSPSPNPEPLPVRSDSPSPFVTTTAAAVPSPAPRPESLSNSTIPSPFVIVPESQSPSPTPGPDKLQWSVEKIAAVASGVVVAVGTSITGVYTAWKWHHKRKALQNKCASPIDDLPRISALGQA